AERREIEADLRLHMLACLTVQGRRGSGRGRAPGIRPLSPRELASAITALVCLRHLDDELLCPAEYPERHVGAALRERAAEVDPDDVLLRREIDELPVDAAWLAAAVDELV